LQNHFEINKNWG